MIEYDEQLVRHHVAHMFLAWEKGYVEHRSEIKEHQRALAAEFGRAIRCDLVGFETRSSDELKLVERLSGNLGRYCDQPCFFARDGALAAVALQPYHSAMIGMSTSFPVVARQAGFYGGSEVHGYPAWWNPFRCRLFLLHIDGRVAAGNGHGRS